MRLDSNKEKVIFYDNTYNNPIEECEALRKQIRTAYVKRHMTLMDCELLLDVRHFGSSVEIIHYLRGIGFRVFMEMKY